MNFWVTATLRYGQKLQTSLVFPSNMAQKETSITKATDYK